MVYYLGRDVKVYLTTESPEAQVSVAANAVSALGGGSSSLATAATAALACADGNDNTNGQFTEGEYVKLTSTDGTVRVYVLCDGSETGAPATGTVLTTGDDTGASTLSSVTAALGTCVAVQNNLNTHSQALVLNEIKAAIVHANGHNGKITCSSDVSVADGAQTITLTQAEKGTTGNKTTAVTTNPQITCANFTGATDGEVYSASTIFAENLDDATPDLTKIPDLTGVDLSIGVTDEDITYIGTKTVLKAEIKKETSVTLTRKKSNNIWDVVYNGPTASNEGWDGSAAETGDYGARWGVIEGAADTWYINNGLMHPKDAVDYGGSVPCFGYRVHIELKNGEEVISIPGCQLVGHTVTLNADGTTEETCELISHVTPKIGTEINYDRLTAADL